MGEATSESTTAVSDKTPLEWKDEGNALFQNRKFKQAAAAYLEGLRACKEDEDTAVRVNLHSNRAMVLLKTQDFEEAEGECTIVIEKYDKKNAKVWYRRALARESNALLMSSEQATEAGLKEAVTDLQEAIRVLRETDGGNAMMKDVLSVAQRIKIHMNNMQKARQEQRRKMIPKDLPEASKQREDVIALLTARKNALSDTQPPGEAFFLIDFDWWADWCFYVKFFQSKTKEELHLLLPGSVVPDEEDRKNDEDLPPEMIDNTDLFLYSPADKDVDPYYLHWYRKEKDGDRELPPLRPNLVRGYHYEIIPREVYHALRHWYGELTPSICRRSADMNGLESSCKIELYPKIAPDESQPESFCGACLRPNASQRCLRCNKVCYCGKSCQQSHWAYHKEFCSPDDNRLAQQSFGRVGLNQLGNTCFMNSALQALSHTTPLTRHFLSSRARSDINKTNPLGTGGELVDKYEGVLKELWFKDQSSTSPIALKRAIAQFAPRFAGYLQHDSQEFLAYFLDGLHEDLNRVHSKPYVEMPDVEDGENMAVAGARAWDQLRRRDDSLVLDTFYGQFKSTCVCPRCNRVSVSFDAFNHVSLQIPQQSDALASFSVLVFSSDNSIPKRYAIELRQSEKVSTLRESISSLCSIPVDRLALCEIMDNRIVENLGDKTRLGTIKPNDLVAAYEVDPFEKANTVHLILSHVLKSDPADDSDLELFGFPLMVSFPSSITCSELWDLIWSKVLTYAGAEWKTMVQVMYIGSKGERLATFPSENGEDGGFSPFLPKESTVPLANYLGADALSSFVQMHLVWFNPNGSEEAKLDEDTFIKFEEDDSYKDIILREQERQAASGVTLDQCFRTFIKPERLDEQNMWYCSKCKDHVRAMKTMELWRLPNILVVHLKRFEFKHSLRRDKLETAVDFPLDGLDMAQYCALLGSDSFVDETVPAIYDCFAVINHFGRMGFGHYTAFARCFDERGIADEWDLFDDSHVRKSAPGSVVSPAAYVLFYRRRQFH